MVSINNGTGPGRINPLVDVFCTSDLSQDKDKTPGIGDLLDGNSSKDAPMSEANVKRIFECNLARLLLLCAEKALLKIAGRIYNKSRGHLLPWYYHIVQLSPNPS